MPYLNQLDIKELQQVSPTSKKIKKSRRGRRNLVVDPALLQDSFSEVVVNTNQIDNTLIQNDSTQKNNGKSSLKLYFSDEVPST